MLFKNGYIVFVVQNETHLRNFQAIIDDLILKGVPRDIIKYISLDSVTGQSVCNNVSNVDVIGLPIKHPINFYLSGKIRRMLWLIYNYKFIAALGKNIKVLVMGNDGAIQRILLRRVKCQNGFSILLLDGLLFPWQFSFSIKSISRYLKKYLFVLGELLNVDWLLPSHVGHSSVDQIYVMDDYVKKVLTAQVNKEIQTIILPRIRSLVSEYCQCREHSGFNVLYITSAFIWHGEVDLAKKQWMDIVDLSEYAYNHPDVNFRIRVHPRESQDEYLKFAYPPNVNLSFKENLLLDDLSWATVVVTSVSTVAYEAKQLNLPVLIYTKNIDLARNSIFSDDDYYIKSNDISILGLITPDRDVVMHSYENTDGVNVVVDKILEGYFMI
ncbi:hypothetical protein GURASL_23660 [Geotalea uraniireducens]|uniref:Uncharacterized protein n=1 Tax=Geotalea uraniireducens TaxID=351604 RepID=A0ABM8ELL2_9BACT|nr:hypothetical protein [Geotalea uraniireducens]BDV43443.1 hypothetical protein GURASL_23660 [Geotalea uraniireducens]